MIISAGGFSVALPQESNKNVMAQTITSADRIRAALFGLFIGDALAMPVHWYYDTTALSRDYGVVRRYLKPRNPHPDSILWRSEFPVLRGVADILHDQRQYWGKRGIHYHQFLEAGENTLNVKLARELLIFLKQTGSYTPDSWLQRMVDFLTSPESHKDTYLEEYLRYFFSAYANNRQLSECGRKDENHIGGFSLMLPLTIACSARKDYARRLSLEHLALTHGGASMRSWGSVIISILLCLLDGGSMSEAIKTASEESELHIDPELYEKLIDYPDKTVVTKHFSSACYVDYAVPATIYLALKYESSPEDGMIANTMCGGDNAGRGAVLGALLGAVNGVQGWPDKWVEGLLHPPPDTQQISPRDDGRLK